MNKKALKLPDGGSLELPIPEGLGTPIFAMNGATTSPYLVYGIGLGVGLLGAWLFLKYARSA
jgi:hypothetical protein